ncbi:MAG: capsular polysaccharide biosynthesis protein [Gammaproteobacteria bacterium]|nr:capsular polysaccharide biosynthesis protein [Gammaproteobacteria bacterium]MBU1775683.1 capsular polysaccharide biosynthesis protein [Gammaproteobacteria bacterium]
MIAVSRAVAHLRGLPSLLGHAVRYRREVRDAAVCGGVIAWGRKPSAEAAAEFAARNRLPLLRLEDGFLRSVGLGAQEPPLSVVVDDTGIYYDATAPSQLESLISSVQSEAHFARARNLVAAWRAARISKYNHTRDYEHELPTRYVLVADQTRGDASIRYGLADETSFQCMLAAALAEHPQCTVLLKVHPEVMAGRKRGHFDLAQLAREPRVQVLGEDVHPVSLLEHAEAVYTVTSQIGFEGLLWGKPVRTFGMPFYAGWGLTQDELPVPERRKPVLLEALVHAALLDYPRYIDPETGLRCEAERVLEWMGLQKRMRARFPSVVYAKGFSIYKREIVRSFFQGSDVRFVRRDAALPSGATLAVWGRKPVAETGVKILRLEDGFIRSVGLGADLVRPLSWVMDGNGIYYDATCPSDLELILQQAHFDDALKGRARMLQALLVAEGLTKYNVGTTVWQRPAGRSRVILVPGQVESDASLAYGAPGIRRNLELLRAVREANPDAWIVYKPHPDVVAGLRRQGQGEDGAARWGDEMLTSASMGELLLAVDEVHTLTSLAGFEALLRGKKVVCYGQPFYAGWGLTEDVIPFTRRTRRLTLDEMVAGVLILYPTYISRSSGKFTTPERALDELLEWREKGAASTPWWSGIYRFVVRRILRKR